MTWKKPSEKLERILEKTVQPYEGEKRKMFGCPVYFVNNNMWVGVFQDSIMMRLSEDHRGEILRTYDDVEMFEPLKGRIMTEYVTIPESMVDDNDLFHGWLQRSYAFVSSLPPKEKKGKKGKMGGMGRLEKK